MESPKPIHIIGGGLAGSEAAWQAARAGVPVVLHEMRPVVGTFAHKTAGLAELVCSNSFRSDDDEQNAVGLLHWEMRAAGGLVIGDRRPPQPARRRRARHRPRALLRRDHRPPRGPPPRHHRPRRGRRPAPRRLDQRDRRHRPADLARARRGDPRPDRRVRARLLRRHRADRALRHRSTSPRPGSSRATTRARPRPSAPPTSTARWTAAEYEAFVDALLAADKTEFKDWERDTPYFEGCLPIEVMAERGRETLRFGPMKPVGLTNPHAPDVEALRRRPAPPRQRARHALQHRRLPDQDEARRPGRGVPHHPRPRERRLRPPRRHPPQHLPQLAAPARRRACACSADPRLRFAGQITGVEGYVESAAMGLLAGRLAAAERLGRAARARRPPPPPSARWSPTSPAAPRPRPSSR